MQRSDAIYFPGLNGIRAMAAFMVIFAHTSNRMGKFGLSPMVREDIASHAVTIFFTLSGFLITYLLLAEKQKTGTIDIKKFYLRRVLRIWPLYYIYLLIVIVVSGFEVNWAILFYLFIIPNLRISFKGLFNIAPGSGTLTSMIGHYWSLGVEEQFYSFWPWIVKNGKYLLKILIFLPIVYVLIKFGLRLIHAPYGIITFFNYTRFGCMAFGGLGAYMYFYHREKLLIFKNRILEIIMYVFFILVLTGKFHITSIIDHEIVSFFTLVLIYNQIANEDVIISFENKILDFLGKISFGLYVYHPLIIYLLSLLIGSQMEDYPWIKTVVILILVILLTILISHLSYNYFEKRFLKIKHKYSTVRSSASKEEYNEKE